MEPLGLNNFQVRLLSSFPQEVDRGTSGAGVSFGAGGPGGWQAELFIFRNLYRSIFSKLQLLPYLCDRVGDGH